MLDQDPNNSDLEPNSTASNATSWKAFFWVTAVLMSLSFIALPIMPNLTIFDYLDFLLSAITVIGLYGFAFYKPIGSVVFWRYFFYLILIESFIATVVFPLLAIPIYGEITQFNTLYLVGAIYMIAMLYAIYQYAYRCPAAWRDH